MFGRSIDDGVSFSSASLPGTIVNKNPPKVSPFFRNYSVARRSNWPNNITLAAFFLTRLGKENRSGNHGISQAVL